MAPLGQRNREDLLHKSRGGIKRASAATRAGRLRTERHLRPMEAPEALADDGAAELRLRLTGRAKGHRSDSAEERRRGGQVNALRCMLRPISLRFTHGSPGPNGECMNQLRRSAPCRFHRRLSEPVARMIPLAFTWHPACHGCRREPAQPAQRPQLPQSQTKAGPIYKARAAMEVNLLFCLGGKSSGKRQRGWLTKTSTSFVP